MDKTARTILRKKKKSDFRGTFLTFAMMYAVAFICGSIYAITVGNSDAWILFGLIVIGYVIYWKLYPGREILITGMAMGFYLAHTLVELHIAGFDLGFLSIYGMMSPGGPGDSMYLIFFDIIRLLYPFLRYVLIIIFASGLLMLYNLKRMESLN